MSETGNNRGPLAGIRVLDLTRVLAAPYATMALGELGAEVIKVERPDSGDETRSWGPPFFAGESAYFLSVNRNKQSIAVDLGDPKGRALVERLAVKWADVLVENFKPGTMAKFGLDAESLREKNPRLITATVRGYPPGDDRPGYDFVIQAASGLMSINGPPDGPGYKVGVAIADITTGLFLLSGIEAALLARERSGRGQQVTVSLWDSQLAWFTNVVQSYLLTRVPPARWGNAHPQLAPYQTFRASDGELVIGVGNDRQFRALCRVVGQPQWADDPRFSTNPARVTHRDELTQLLGDRLKERPRAFWLASLDREGVPAGPVRTIPEAIDWAREQGLSPTRTVVHPTVGPMEQVPLPWHFSETPTAITAPPPLLGQHTLDLLRRMDEWRKDAHDE